MLNTFNLFNVYASLKSFSSVKDTMLTSAGSLEEICNYHREL